MNRRTWPNDVVVTRTGDPARKGVVRDINQAVYPPLCRVFWGAGETEWVSLRYLDTHGRAKGTRRYGVAAAVLHVDASHATPEQIRICVQEMQDRERSTYVSHLERVRPTRHRHAIGTRGEFFPYAGPHVADAPSSPCTVVSHDTCYTWSGYTDSYYTIEFEDGSRRRYVRGSQVAPIVPPMWLHGEQLAEWLKEARNAEA